MTLPTIQPIVPPRSRKRPNLPPTASPVGPALVWASFSEDGYVQLRFDRAIDADGFVGVAIRVDDYEQSGLCWVGQDGPEQLDNFTILVTLDSDGPATVPGQRLVASAGNGIVAADGGAAWAGADVALPFG